MIKISNLHKSFGDLHVLKGIDLQVNQGDIIAIIGPSGSGKSTLLHCINKLEEPTVGHVFIDDEDSGGRPGNGAGRRVRRGCAERFRENH